MKTVRVYRLAHLEPPLFRRLKAAQMEAAQVWNVCVDIHKQARMGHVTWPNQNDVHQATKGRFALHSQSVQAVFRAFLGTIETTRKLRREHPEMARAYPWREKRFYPVHWPAQAVSVERRRVVLPMGKGRPSVVLPLDLPENAGSCTLVWNDGFELHVCVEVPREEQAPGSVQATVDLGEIHLAAVTTNSANLPKSRAGARSIPAGGRNSTGRRTRRADEPSDACATCGTRRPGR